ncbi:MAG: DUF2130 domain-containing protein [Flavobacteriales bacterium]|nr:DUF2130 domain-containing protein [Flavobacteriales bacterium]
MTNNNSIQCPKCNEVFKVDDSLYIDIVKQVRDKQFNDEINNRLEAAEKDKLSSIELVKSQMQSGFQEQLNQKEREIADLKLKSREALIDEVSKKEDKIRELTSKLEQADAQKKLEVSTAVNQIEKEKDKLENELSRKETEKELLEKSLNEQFNNQLKAKDELLSLKDGEIERLKDYKQKLSTKMLGESLEQHCETEFNKLRATAFQNAYFEKDNDASDGTKGDYIYREEDHEGNEIVSIMFEMKNENETTSTKKKNIDFLDKLDKDRKSKGCEYAVLVSLLETDNDYYNLGIVDMSHKYEKMYVIRPQFFIQLISLLRNSGLKSLIYKAELKTIRDQNIDITNFEEKITNFKEGFAKNYETASKHFEKAIEEIDKSIARMEAVKTALTTSANQLRLANNKADDLSIKKLTYNNPTMKAKFDELNK